MTKRTMVFSTIAFLLMAATSATAQANLITANSAGTVKLGMTIAQLRKAVTPMKLSRTSDGEGVALIAVKQGNNVVMTIFAGEEDRDAAISDSARIEQIWAWSKAYKTEAGIHPGMPVSQAETILGPVKEIVRSEIESREFAEFAYQPSGIHFRLKSGDGDFPAGSTTTTTYRPTARIYSINVVGDRPSKDGVTFSSEFTDLLKDCKSVGGIEGGHVSHFCKGTGNYQIHYFDAATVYQINATTTDREWEVPLQMIGLDKLDAVGSVEWRLANGEPYAVLVRKPGTDTVIVRGLKGFKRIKYEESGGGGAERARSMADNDYEDIIAPSTRLNFASSSNIATASAHLKNVRDKLKYVVSAKAGDRLTVKIEAKKWAGDEGLIMVGIVIPPDGEGVGGPGGTVFDDVLAQGGDYEILVYQNAAKSQAKDIDVTVTVTLAGGKEQPLEAIAAPFLPKGSKPLHDILKGDLGGSTGNIVVLHGKEAPAVTYDGFVLVPRGSQFERFDLPRPDFTWSIEQPKAVFFANADRDPELELFIIGECYTGIGPTGARPFYRTRVYDRQGDGFVHLESVSSKIGTLKTATAIRQQLRAIVSPSEARFM